ncbi:MAG: LacI family DNA-binding transcriptional regulator [Lentisphaeria bacterium]|nr:LacI family DNA-binding transcriptional regulator [Lentisphaeria bacterium]
MNTAPKQPGLKEIASLCGVSLMTVSRAFRQDTVIHPETRSRILRTAEMLHYHHSSRRGRPRAAKPREQRQVQLILGICNGSTAYFHMRLLCSLEQQLASSGYECLIRTSPGDYDIFIRLLDNARKHKCAATLVMGDLPPEQLSALIAALPGVILLDNTGEYHFQGSYSSFSFDNQKAAFIGAEHLIKDCRRRRILLVNGRKGHFFSEELLSGYKKALALYGIPFDDSRVLYTDFSAASAAEALREHLEAGGSFDAVLSNDEMASGVYRILHEYGRRIPEEVAVCGCDDLPVGKQLYPELTSISLDYTDLARKAIALLDDSSRRFPGGVHTKLQPVLKRASSTGSPTALTAGDADPGDKQ